jgi:hypothetical protein
MVVASVMVLQSVLLLAVMRHVLVLDGGQLLS